MVIRGLLCQKACHSKRSLDTVESVVSLVESSRSQVKDPSCDACTAQSPSTVFSKLFDFPGNGFRLKFSRNFI